MLNWLTADTRKLVTITPKINYIMLDKYIKSDNMENNNMR